MSGENTDPRTEQGIGRSLESARKSRGLSLWQVEQETRIRSRYLRDLEREDFDVLPAVYVLGSLKTYADFLGLDGGTLSGQLKASLIEPDVAAQAAVIGGARDEDDEYEAAPVPAVGFDQLFLGMGVILISILAIMTLATALAQGDGSPVSQVDRPSTPEPPSEIALAGNVQDGEEEGDGTGPAGNEEDGQGDAPEASKGDQQGEEEDQEEDQNASKATSTFGDAEFVPMSPPSTSSASASASPAPSTAKPADSSVPAAPASRERSRPANDSPRAASAPSDASAPASVATPAPAQAPPPAGPQGGGGGPSPQGPASGSGQISADVDRVIDEVFRENGLD